MAVDIREAGDYLNAMRQSEGYAQKLKKDWADIAGITGEAGGAQDNLNGKVREQNELTKNQKRELRDALSVTNSLIDEFVKLAPETRDWADALQGALSAAVRFASGDIIGGILQAIGSIGEAISEVILVTKSWGDTLKNVDDLYDDVRSAVEKSWTTMDKQVKAGELSLQDELAALKTQQKFQGFLNLSDEERLDLKLKIMDIEKDIYDQSVKKEEELRKAQEARRNSEIADLRKKIELGLIDMENLRAVNGVGSTLRSLGYSGIDLAGELKNLGMGGFAGQRSVSVGQINQYNYEATPDYAARGISGIIRDTTSGG
ncbi:MAG: hypothetical protein HPY53_04840 [Brevinematales bacterium]|nr:hypothetical protein [Brevinematales bacterium]